MVWEKVKVAMYQGSYKFLWSSVSDEAYRAYRELVPFFDVVTQ